jgi:hypothetical protein
MTEKLEFHYDTGEIVVEGDEVAYSGNAGVVDKILAAGSPDAAGYSCADTGGILLSICWGRMLMTPPDGDLWEDLDFVRRRQATN